MLNAKKMKKVCLVTVSILAILAAMVFGFASCSEPTATGLTYKSGLEKDTYELNETFDPTGAVMELTYSDGTKEEVSYKDLFVGTVPLVNEGKVDVTVTYNLNGTLIEGKIPVTVKNTLGDAKTAQKAAAAALVANITVDTNIQIMWDLCNAVIDSAKTAEEATAAVTKFQTQLTAYNAGVAADTALANAKAAQVAAAKAHVAAADMNADLQVMLDLCIANIANAATAEEATAAVTAYKAKVADYQAVVSADAALGAAKEAAKNAAAALIEAEELLAEDVQALEMLEDFYATVDAAADIAAVDAAAAAFEASLDDYIALTEAKLAAIDEIVTLVDSLFVMRSVTLTANMALVQSDATSVMLAVIEAESVEEIEIYVESFAIYVDEYKTTLAEAQAAIDAIDYSNMPTICQQMMDAYLASAVAAIATATDYSAIPTYVAAYEAQFAATEVVANNYTEDGALVEVFAQMTAALRAQRDEILVDPWYSDESKVEVMEATDYAIDKILMIMGSMDEEGKTNADAVVDAFEQLIEDTDTLIDDIYQAYIALGCPHGADACAECAKSSTPDASGNIHYTDECYDMIDDLALLISQANAIDPVKAKAALEEYSRRTPENVVVNLITGPVEGVNAKLEGINNKAFIYDDYITSGVIAGGRHDVLGEAAYGAQVELVYDSDNDSVPDMTLVDMIAAIGAAEDVNIDSLPAIQTAYTYYVAWAEYFYIIDTESATLNETYGVNLYTAVDGNDESVLVPNYDDLWAAWDAYLAVKAALDEELDALREAIDAIGKVMIGVVPEYDAEGNLTNGDVAEFRVDGTAVDSAALIKVAEDLKVAFEANDKYNVAAHPEYYVVDNGDGTTTDYAAILTDARTAYTDLTSKVTNLNSLIGRLLVDGDEVIPEDKATLDTIKAADDAFAAINSEGDIVYRGLITYYYHYEDIYEKWSVEYTEAVVKGEKIAAIDAEVLALGGAAELVAIADEYKAQIEEWAGYTLPEDVAQLDAYAYYVAELQAIVDAAIAALNA